MPSSRACNGSLPFLLFFCAVKLNANRQVTGTLRGFDQFMNLVLDGTVDDKLKVDIGMVVSFRGGHEDTNKGANVRGGGVAACEELCAGCGPMCVRLHACNMRVVCLATYAVSCGFCTEGEP